MKKILTLLSISFLMFMFGRLTTGVNQDATEENIEISTSYIIEGDYIQSDIDYQSEAVYIKSTYKPNMSTSKIKHLLIYINGFCRYNWFN